MIRNDQEHIRADFEDLPAADPSPARGGTADAEAVEAVAEGDWHRSAEAAEG